MAYAFAGSNPALPTDKFGFSILDFGLGGRRAVIHEGGIRNPLPEIQKLRMGSRV
jgi:hypothetical protein